MLSFEPRLYIGITDKKWYEFLSCQPEIDEINFWQPGGHQVFSALEAGRPFLFKLHSPDNFIVGGGFFVHANILPLSLAWDSFGNKNGAASLDEMRRRIEKYRRIPSRASEDYSIGCILLTQPFFLRRDQWIPAPQDFSLNIVQGKSYSLVSNPGKILWEQIQLTPNPRQITPDQPVLVADQTGPRYGEPYIAKARLGQGTFRVLVTDVYQRKCAVTGEKALPALDVAHIKAYGMGGEHRLDNGLLLRADIHHLFDKGYVTVTPDYHFEASKRLKTEFQNGREYYVFHGKQIWVPPVISSRPGREFLEWHSENVFKP